jgi:hypothetical protein
MVLWRDRQRPSQTDCHRQGIDRQADRQKDEDTGRQADRHTFRKVDGQADRETKAGRQAEGKRD